MTILTNFRWLKLNTKSNWYKPHSAGGTHSFLEFLKNPGLQSQPALHTRKLHTISCPKFEHLSPQGDTHVENTSFFPLHCLFSVNINKTIFRDQMLHSWIFLLHLITTIRLVIRALFYLWKTFFKSILPQLLWTRLKWTIVVCD